MSKLYITWEQIYKLVKKLPKGKIYGIPRGGSIIAGLTGRAVESVEKCDYIVDDIIDSGRTKLIWEKKSTKKVVGLIDKKKEGLEDWLVFPWESQDLDVKDSIISIISHIGDDPRREGLIDTPERVIKSFKEMYSGYMMEPKTILARCFQVDYDQIVLLKDIEIYSTCEHHMLPFYGKAHIAYIPQGKVVGISKLARLVECFSRRLQIQERLCNQVVDALDKHLNAKGSACIIEAKHMCMTCRGINKQNSTMVTSALRGIFLNDNNAKSELMRLI